MGTVEKNVHFNLFYFSENRSGSNKKFTVLGSTWLDSTWARIDSARKESGSNRLEMRSDRLGSTWVQVNSARHEPELTQLDTGSGRLYSTWVGADSTWYGPELTRHGIRHTRFNIGPGRLESTWARFDSARRGPDQLSSTWARVDLVRHGPCSTRLDMGLNQHVWIWTRVDLAQLELYPGPSRLNPTRALIILAGLSLVSSLLDLGWTDLTRSRLGLIRWTLVYPSQLKI